MTLGIGSDVAGVGRALATPVLERQPRGRWHAGRWGCTAGTQRPSETHQECNWGRFHEENKGVARRVARSSPCWAPGVEAKLAPAPRRCRVLLRHVWGGGGPWCLTSPASPPRVRGGKRFSTPEPRGRLSLSAEEWPLRELALSLALRGRQLVVFVANDKIQTFKQKQKLANVYAHCTDFDCSTVCTDLSEQIGGVRM